MVRYQLTEEPVLRVYMTGRGQRYLPVAELLSMQAEANYTWLLLKSGERILIPRTLKYLEECLPIGRFVRLRRHYTVNVDAISQIELTRYNRMTVRLRTGEEVVVARRRILPLRQQLVLDTDSQLEWVSNSPTYRMAIGNRHTD